MTAVSVPVLPQLAPKLRGLRAAELLALLFFSVVMALPVLFLLIGSFNVAQPGHPAVYGLDNWVRAFSIPRRSARSG